MAIRSGPSRTDLLICIRCGRSTRWAIAGSEVSSRTEQHVRRWPHRVADKRGATPVQIALALLLGRYDPMLLIPGSSSDRSWRD